MKQSYTREQQASTITETKNASAAETMRRALAERFGCLTPDDVAIIAAAPAHRLRLLLVRCGGCRFLAPAQDVQHLIDIITRERTDHVRDVSIPAEASR